MSHYKTIKALGTPHVVYQGLVDFLDDFELAVMLSHLLYWSDKTNNPLGVYRSNAEWYELYRFKDAKVKSLSDKLQKRGLIKKTYKRLDHRMYYLLDIAEFDRQYEIFANQQNNISPIAKIKIGEQQKQRLADGQNQDSLYTKITTKNTNKDYCKESEYDTHESTQENFENSQNSSQTKPTAKPKKSKDCLAVDDLMNLKLSDFNFTDKDFKDYPNLGDWIFENMDYQIAKDYLAMRTNKLTMTAIKSSVKQASIAGLNLSQALEVCITSGKNGWQTFKADWYFNAQKTPAWQPTNRMDELRHMANTNPTSVFVDDLPPSFYELGASQ